MNSSYYNLATVRKVRRKLRRVANKTNREIKSFGHARLVLHDERGADVLKSRKFKGRIRQTELL